ncbi:MAG: helix-turn-helix transcriptional regulator [Clostridia bacterium]|nr:helix-turn-helix transcriptional regulator [Clostridia bacterium]
MNEEYDRSLEEEVVNEESSSGDKSISSDLIRGHINTIILRSLYDGDKYGYEIIAEIERKSRGQYSLKQPSLYSALKRLEKEGYVTCYWGGSVGGGRRKYFSLTEQGKLISERNQSEWEYSRTVIDSLISEKEFDFSQPAPTPVDMRVLKKTTSRVPTGSASDEEEEDEEKTALLQEQERLKAELEEERAALISEREAIEAEKERILAEYERQTAERERILNEERRAQEVAIAEQELRIKEREEFERQVAERERMLSEERIAHEKELAEQEKRIREEEATAYASRERQILHENYLRLINSPPAQQAEENTDYNYYTPPVAEETPSPVYEEERDYRTVVQSLYRNALSTEEPTEELKRTQPSRMDFYDLETRAAQDGIKINVTGGKTVKKDEPVSENVVHKGKIVFLCSIIVFLFCVVEGSVVLALQKSLTLPLFYPYLIWGAGLSFLLIAGVAYANRYGENSLKRAGMTLINCIVSYVLIVIFFLILALALKIDFTDASTLATYVLIPIFFFLNVVVYGIAYTLQMKSKK